MIIVKYSFFFLIRRNEQRFEVNFTGAIIPQRSKSHLEPKIYHITEYFWTKNIVLLEMPMQKTKSINTKWEHKLPAERVNVSP